MWVWILAVFLLLLIWGGGFVLGLLEVVVPTWLQIVGTLLVVLMVVGVIVWRRLRARARAKALEEEIMRQSEQQAAAARPDRRAEILQLQQQVQRGIKALQETKVGKKHGKGALYVLPWYAIIGPPGAGKTTALRHSGLVFPFLDAQGGGVKGVGGTRNCDWWFTNEGILLDTAGRYATEEDDRDEWLAFLGMLRKFRPEKPINGLLVAVAISDLIEATEEDLTTTAAKLRGRIDEIMTRLDMVLPVYLVFTKADLVGGFVEFWGDLRKSERDQLFGATFPLDQQERDAGELFVQQFELLNSVVHARSLSVISRERRPELRAKIYQFPLELRSLRNNLESFTRHLFQRNNFQENPIFRGFYFTSGTQEGRPLDRIISGMARAFGIQTAQTFEAPKDPKSYFVTDVFRQVVFPDQYIAGRTAAELRRRKFFHLAVAGSALLIGLLIVLPALGSFFKNGSLIGETKQIAATSSGINWTGGESAVQKVTRLDGTRTQLKKLDNWNEEGAPIGMRWWLYQGETLYPALRDAYVGNLNQGLATPAKKQIEGELRSLAMMTNLPSEKHAQFYNTLKLYIMLTTVKYLDVDWATPRLGSVWSNALLAKDKPKAEEVMEPHVRYYLELMKREEIPPWQSDAKLVARARSALLRAPQLERMYAVLVRDANEAIAPITRETIFYGSVAPFVTSSEDRQVEGAYTKEGWSRVKKLLGEKRSNLSDETWVLGEEKKKAEEEIEKQVDQLMELYFARFKNAWRDFILDLSVESPTDANQSLEELNALSEPEWPYLRLLRTLHENVTLDVDDPNQEAKDSLLKLAQKEAKKRIGVDAGVKVEAQKRTVSEVEKAFKPMTSFAVAPEDAKGDAPTGLAQYQATLAKLVGVLTDLRDGDPQADPKAVAGEYEAAFRSVSAMLANQDGFTRPMMSPLLIRPITGSWTGVVNDAGGAASGLWEVSVWDKWHSKLEPFYPFSNAVGDAKLDDFTEFFAPDGILWSFYNENLAGSINRVGNTFSPRRRFKAAPNFGSDFLVTCLQKSAIITEVLFGKAGKTPALHFDINLHSVSKNISEVTLEIDGVTHVYRNTPEEWLSTTWPAKEAKAHGARVRIRGFSGLDEEIIRDGDFGLFRLLDSASNIARGRAGGKKDGVATLVATWNLPSDEAFFKLDVRQKREDVEMSAKLFRDAQCPRVIATASE